MAFLAPSTSISGLSLTPISRSRNFVSKHSATRRYACITSMAQQGMKPYDSNGHSKGRFGGMKLVESKQDLVQQLLLAKYRSGKTFTQIGKELGVTNLYAAQLFHNQAQLTELMQPRLTAAVPDISGHLLEYMRQPPMRSFDPLITQDPSIYRLTEAVLHYGESIKAVMNEELGDGIMSAIDMYSDVKVIEGKQGEKRVCITLNGKFLPHVEQRIENNTAPQ